MLYSGGFFHSLFVVSTVLLWLLTVGYAFLLVILRRPAENRQFQTFPEITVVIAVLNEADWICRKIENILQSSYPSERIEIVIVDGGSDDASAEIAEACVQEGLRMRVLLCPGGSGKAEQINAGIRAAQTELVVCTDADTMLDRDCLMHLVAALQQNHSLDIAGARIVPVTDLFEEKIHWHIVNMLWWLEGKVFDSAGISGACYAAHKRVFRAELTADAEDVELARRSALQGYGAVVTVWPAVAFEQRVPDTIAKWVEYRLRRGKKYRNVVMQQLPGKGFHKRCLVQYIRISQFVMVPFLSICSLVSGILLLAGGQQPATMPVFAAGFVLSTFPIVAPLYSEYGMVRTTIGSIRWIILLVYVLLVFQCSGENLSICKPQPDDIV